MTPPTFRRRSRLAASALLFLLPLLCLHVPATSRERATPVPIILDTDIGPDVDDAGAVAVLHALADRGEARVLAMGCCTSSRWGAPCLDALNTWYGRPDVPVGTLKGRPGFLLESRYNERVAKDFPNDLRDGERAPDAVDVYRKALARAKDRSVVFVAVGPLPNMARLLESGPDRVSRLSGKELVRRKVRLLSVMGGKYPAGKEWNFEQDPAAAAKVAAEWPTPVLYSGFEIGERIHTGRRLHAETPAQNPVRAAYALFPGVDKDRESWDLTAVLAAVRGPEAHWTVSGPGRAVVAAGDGSNGWEAGAGDQRYLVQRDAPEAVKRALEDLMVQAPRPARGGRY